MSLGAYLHSIRYLTFEQLSSRIRMLVRRKLLNRSQLFTARYRADGQVAQSVRPIAVARNPVGDVDVASLARGTFTLLNRPVALGWPIDWSPASETQLWRYNLHYFDYALALADEYRSSQSNESYELFRNVVRQWLDKCPIGIPVAWDPYPVSLRIRNWILAFTAFAEPLAADPGFAEQLRRSIYVHARFLEDNIETHLSGNHLIENGRALLFAGLFFTVGRAPRWQRLGGELLWHQLDAQFTVDGGHYERSPMYHQMMLELYVEVVEVLLSRGEEIPDGTTEAIQRMRRWLAVVSHPDGGIPLLNDAAMGVTRTPAAAPYAKATPDGLTSLDASGYHSFRRRDSNDFLVFDAGPLGPNHQPGHGHCDCLSYELSVSGQRVIVDSGVDDYYGALDWRAYYRSTRAHNTVQVDGAEQSEIWHRFRVARRAEPKAVIAQTADELEWVAGSHTGYERMQPPVAHRRFVAWPKRAFWIVVDRLDGHGDHEFVSFVHFHPGVEIIETPTAQTPSGLVRRSTTSLAVIPFGVDDVGTTVGAKAPIQGWYAPELGRAVPNTVWSLQATGSLPRWLGYVLWPRPETDVAVNFDASDDRCVVQVRHADVETRVAFDFDGVVPA